MVQKLLRFKVSYLAGWYWYWCTGVLVYWYWCTGTGVLVLVYWHWCTGVSFQWVIREGLPLLALVYTDSTQTYWNILSTVVGAGWVAAWLGGTGALTDSTQTANVSYIYSIFKYKYFWK